MRAKISTNSIPKEYRDAIDLKTKKIHKEISKRLILSASLVGSDMFGWQQDECLRFTKGLAEILHGYNEEIYNCRDNVGDIKDYAAALDEELRSRGIIIEFEE